MNGPKISIMKAFGPLLCILSIFGCAYFNTFYNAQQYYKAAEKIRLEKYGQALPSNGIDAYMSAIKKSTIVLEKYPDSRFRRPAMILMAKSRFHIREYNLSRQIFLQLKEEYPQESSEADYWLSLCKWKQGKFQPALNELTAQLQIVDDLELKARMYFSMADIYLETNQDDQAMQYLVQGAELMNDRNERAEIYFRLTDLAIAAEDYELAIEACRNVIRNSLTSKRVVDANLNLVKIYRMQEDWDEVSSLIKKLLSDESFTAIWAKLELELAKLDLANDDAESAISRLEGLTADYARTESSAEAYFLLGEYAVMHTHDFEAALKSFKQVTKEYGKTPFKKRAQVREKEINTFLATLEKISSFRETVTNTDSLDIDTTSITEEVSKDNDAYAASLYSAGELWAFHFDNPDSALSYFFEIADSLNVLEWTPKATYTLVYLLNDAELEEESTFYKESLLAKYPKSEYAQNIRKTYNIEQQADPNYLKLLKAESIKILDEKTAIDTYREIAAVDSTEEIGLKAVYALAYYYDLSAVIPDSALKYYQWMESRYPQSESFLQVRQRYETMIQLVASMKQDTVIVDESD